MMTLRIQISEQVKVCNISFDRLIGSIALFHIGNTEVIGVLSHRLLCDRLASFLSWFQQ